MSTPTVTQMNLLSMQVCVPKDWTDDQVVAFAEREYPCGTTNGWSVRNRVEEVPEYQARVTCGNDDDFCHVMLDA